jgi:type VI protein secretion system component VasK
VAAIIVGGSVALEMERRIKARLTAHGGPLWLASVDGLIWAVAPFMLLGAMEAGLLALALYATGSFAYVQWRLWRWATKHQV